jgi:hypothetical protein
MAEPGRVVYTSRVRIERQKGPMLLAYLPAEKELVTFGLHSEVPADYVVSPDAYLTLVTTLDYIVAAAGG